MEFRGKVCKRQRAVAADHLELLGEMLRCHGHPERVVRQPADAVVAERDGGGAGAHAGSPSSSR